jgi:hypothetical protein
MKLTVTVIASCGETLSKFSSWSVRSKFSFCSTTGDKYDPCVDVTSSVSFLLSVPHHVILCYVGWVCVCFVSHVISGVTAN